MRTLKVILFSILVFGFLTITFPTYQFQFNNIDIKTASPRSTLIVDINGTGDYTIIQNAIDNASEGDVIVVEEGIYLDRVTIDKSIELKGKAKENTIIDHSIKVYSDNVRINGFTFSKRDLNGITLYSNNNAIEDNIFLGRHRGIAVSEVSVNTISNNSFIDSTVGIYLYYSEVTYIEDNTFTNSTVWISYSNTTTMRRNDFIDDCIDLRGEFDYHFSSHNIDESNTFEGAPIIYRSGESNQTIEGKDTYIYLANCDNYEINNSSGHVEFWYCTNSRITNCNFVNHEGVVLGECEGMDISYNTFKSTVGQNWMFEDGIVIEKSLVNSTIRSNSMTGSILMAFYFDYMYNVTIENNHFDDMEMIYVLLTNSKILNNTFNKGYIALDFVKNVTLKNNKFYETGPNLEWYKFVGENRPAYLEIDSSNTVNDKPIYCYLERENEVVPPGAGMIVLIECHNVTVKDQEITRTSKGVFLINSSSCVIEGNNCSNNDKGIECFLECNDNIFRNNTCNDNQGLGMDFSTKKRFDRNQVYGNMCNRNWGGIGFWGSENDIRENVCNNNEASGLNIAGDFSNEFLYCANNSIKSNIFKDNAKNGIYSSHQYFGDRWRYTSMESSLISNNICVGNLNGIYLGGTNLSIIDNNCSENAEDGISAPSGYEHIDSSDIIGNLCLFNGLNGININGDELDCVSNDCSNNGVDGIRIYSRDAKIIDNYCCFNNDSGIDARRFDLLVENNICDYNNFGFYSSGISMSFLSNNSFSNNRVDGIYLERKAYNNTIHRNYLENNSRYGLILTEVGYHEYNISGRFEWTHSIRWNNISLNSFIKNNNGSNQAKDDSYTNKWNVSGKGNYWSDWIEPDRNGDGIVDVPYNITGNGDAVDHYPLVIPLAEDSDRDGINDIVEDLFGTDPFDPLSFPQDLDEDGIPDEIDEDKDGDGHPNEEDHFPDDPDRWDRPGEEFVTLVVIIIIIILVVLAAIIILYLLYFKKKAVEDDKVPTDDEKPLKHKKERPSKKEKESKKKPKEKMKH